MNTAALASIGIISLFVVSQITSLKLGITNNLFYAPFHFTSGFLLGVLFLSLGANKVLTLLAFYLLAR